MNRHPAGTARDRRVEPHAFHARTGQFYHDNDRCPFTRGIDPGSRLPGTGGLNECIMCRQLNTHDQHPTKI
ncbi:MAG: hypothetical protein LKI98_04315 [Bifidobacterium crudilactis]|jgi:hypothetical protein|nr:hypothetical protein [Bifidobacterium crudilactis]MCI1889645.1 hypothetical protein [Bifidobacterium crudilactis]